MGFIRRVTEISEQIGGGIADFQLEIAEESRKFVCNLWQQFPASIVTGDNVVGSASRGYMNALCQDMTLPDPPTAPSFSGGQCMGVTYAVEYRYRAFRFDNCQPQLDITQTVNLPGAIGEPFQVNSGNISNTTNCFGANSAPLAQYQWRIPHGSGEFTEPNVNPDARDDNLRPLLTNFEILSVTRLDGLPDDCGSLPSSYPPSNIAPADLSGSIVVGSADGVPVPLPVTIDPSLISFPIVVDVGGITLEFNLGGVEFNFGGRSSDLLPLPLPDGSPNPFPIPRDDPRRRIPCPRLPSPAPGNFDEEICDEATSAEKEVGENLRFVKLSLANLPDGIKSIAGLGAPDVFFAGWLEFTSETCAYPREQVNFMNGIFAAPDGATGFAYTVRKGVLATATIYTQQE